jgi:hypothetical protein
MKLEQADKSQLAVKARVRQLFPATAPPPLASMRPDPSHNPAVELSEEPSDVSPLEVVAPTQQKRIQVVNQLLGRNRGTTAG